MTGPKGTRTEVTTGGYLQKVSGVTQKETGPTLKTVKGNYRRRIVGGYNADLDPALDAVTPSVDGNFVERITGSKYQEVGGLDSRVSGSVTDASGGARGESTVGNKNVVVTGALTSLIVNSDVAAGQPIGIATTLGFGSYVLQSVDPTTGGVSITAGGLALPATAGAMNLTSVSLMTLTSGAAVSVLAGAAIDMKATAAITIDAGGILSLKAGGAASVVAVGALTLTAPTVAIGPVAGDFPVLLGLLTAVLDIFWGAISVHKHSALDTSDPVLATAVTAAISALKGAASKTVTVSP